MKQVKKQKGFTIIELVVVILLLGILTATALPRFMDVTDDAHEAVVDAVVGGLATGTSLFRAQWFADGQPNTIAEFNGLAANGNGYPIGQLGTAPMTTTLLSSVGSSANCVAIFQGLLQPGGQPTINALASSTTGLGSTSTLGSDLRFSLTSLADGEGLDFVAYLAQTNTAAKSVCYYVYTGQYSDSDVNDMPTIIYNAATGTIVKDTDLL